MQNNAQHYASINAQAVALNKCITHLQYAQQQVLQKSDGDEQHDVDESIAFALRELQNADYDLSELVALAQNL